MGVILIAICLIAIAFYAHQEPNKTYFAGSRGELTRNEIADIAINETKEHLGVDPKQSWMVFSPATVTLLTADKRYDCQLSLQPEIDPVLPQTKIDKFTIKGFNCSSLTIPNQKYLNHQRYCKQDRDCRSEDTCGCSCGPNCVNIYHHQDKMCFNTCHLYCGPLAGIGQECGCVNHSCQPETNRTLACQEMCNIIEGSSCNHSSPDYEMVKGKWNQYNCSQLTECRCSFSD